MTDQHMTDHPTITPPPELMRQWREQAPRHCGSDAEREERLIERAAQWGADQELEACCELLELSYDWDVSACEYLRVERRPKPSLKEQALAVLEDANLDAVHYNIIRRALEDSNG